MLLPLLMTLAAHEAPFYVGTYTAPGGSRGVYRATLDRETGAISAPVLAAECESPSYLVLSGDRLYACNETDAGAATAYRIGKGGGLTLLNAVGGLGAYPCHLAVAGDRLLVANYGAGSVSALPLAKDGSLGTAATVKNAGSGPNKARQAGPHLHYVHALKDHVYACDLGTDEILVYPFSGSVLGEPDRTKTHPGAGPRHLAFSKDGRFAWANGELDNSVIAYAVDPTGPLTALQTLSTLPAGFKGQSHSAEIAVHPSGRFVYVSNRGDDSLATFAVGKDGTLSMVEVHPAGVREPRGFGIDPSGRWMIVGGQSSDDLVSMPIDPRTGRLGEIAGRAKLGKPVCVAFRP